VILVTHSPVTLTWHGHSCFSLNNGTWTLVLDPYKPDMIGYPPLQVRAHAMLASHQHEDHNYQAAVTFLHAPRNIVLPAGDEPEANTDNHFLVRTVASSHDAQGGSRRGQNEIHVIRTNGLTIAHLGDLGHLLSDKQAAEIGQVDLLLIPVGGYYTIDARQALQTIEQLKPRNVAPMHYQIGYGKLPIAMVEPFLSLIEPAYPVILLPGAQLELDRDMSGNCFLFKYEKETDPVA
jgi:L-ascorbate metabolism protein UlaG (beta-lactamase superfamily)